jgi:di- and tripeptidase
MVQVAQTNANLPLTDSPVDSDDDSSTSCTHELIHCLQHDKSILSLVVSSSRIFAGTEGGEILVYDLETFKRRTCIIAHEGSVLGLFLSSAGKLLFSCGADHFVNVRHLMNKYAILN